MVLSQNIINAHAPLLQGDKAHQYFFSVHITGKRYEARYVSSKTGQDKDLLPLHDYGYYVAGVEAKKSYLRLMHHWRQSSKLPNYLLSRPKKCEISVVGKLTETSSFDCRSSQLTLLLGMIVAQQKSKIKHIYATGELNNLGDLPIVEPVSGLDEKLNAILDKIAQTQELEPILIALPKYVTPGKGSEANNCSETRYARRINSFIHQHKSLNINVIYCHHLSDDLENHLPSINAYHHLSRRLHLFPIGLIIALFLWQYQQPLYLNWDNDKVLRPLRVNVQNKEHQNIIPLCPQSKLGEAVFSIGDLVVINVTIDDFSWLKNMNNIHAAIVLIGENSGIRVESLPKKTSNQFQTAFLIEPPKENYLIVAIARKNFSIDKGKLNKQLSQLINGLSGIERLSTASGYLEKHFDSLPYRFRITAPNCKETT